jgi:hypothetical protein
MREPQSVMIGDGAPAAWSVVGGLLGTVIGRDVGCEVQRVAYRVYAAKSEQRTWPALRMVQPRQSRQLTSTREFHRGDHVLQFYRDQLLSRREL